MKLKTGLILAGALCYPLPSVAVDLKSAEANQENHQARASMGEKKGETRFHRLIDEAADVYSAITKGKHGEVPASVLKLARCIAVIPNVSTGAVLVGFTRGEGLASCKDANDVWSQPAPVVLKQGSIGLQAGVRKADLVLFFQTNEAVQSLKRGEFKFGTDISAVAGTYDSKVDTSSAGAVLFSRAEGVFAGASINESTLAMDQGDIDSFYGKGVEYIALLEGRISPIDTRYTKNLTRLFP